MAFRHRMVSITAAAGLVGLGTVGLPAARALAGPSGAPSGNCNDGAGDEVKEVPLLTSPVTLAVEIGAFGSAVDHVGICYSTTAEGSSGPEAAGGDVAYYIGPTDSDPLPIAVGNSSDPGSAVQATAGSFDSPAYTVSPGGGSGGQVVTVFIPVSVCASQCVAPTLGTTGVMVGTLSKPHVVVGGTNQDYELTGLCVLVDGAPLNDCSSSLIIGGLTTTGTSPLNVEKGGPCVGAACLPIFGDSYVGTTGNQLATIYLPVLGTAIPVNGVHTCVYHTPSTNPCPA
jgi:hypothetical protein